MDLQLFAQERTEEATPRRLRQAREEGRSAKSADLMTGAGLTAAAMALKSLGPSFYNLMAGGMTEALGNLKPVDLSPELVGDAMRHWALVYVKAVTPIAGVIIAVGVALGLLQTRFNFALKPVMPDFNRINPASGLERMFSLNTVVELVKGLAKVIVVGYVAYRDVIRLLPEVPNLMRQNVAVGAATIAGNAVSAMLTIGVALLALGVLDYGYQYWQFMKSVRMTKQEVKQEFREQEGSPELKQKQRQIQREMARRRKALKDVPQADVIITNPTHFAVALKYDAQEQAPRLLAKGADLMAAQIRDIAREHKIPMVENRPLARTLYSTVDVGKMIPPELYQAVAEVLAFVFSQRRQNRYESGTVR